MPPPSKESEALASHVAAVGGHLSSALDFLSAAGAGGRGVVALSRVPKGSNLAAVPVRACLFVPKEGEHHASTTPAAEFLREQQKEELLSPFPAAVALLLAEAAAGERSPHSRFLASLPFGGEMTDANDDDETDPENENGSTVKCLDCVLAWRARELKLLSGTSAEDQGGGARKLFEETMKPLYASSPTLWPRPYDSFAAFVRAACLVQSRAFHLRETNFATGAQSDDADGGGRLYLIPGIDQVNHSSSTAMRSTALDRVSEASASGVVDEGEGGKEEDGKGKEEKKEEGEKIDFFSMKADRDIEAGEEVFHGYGDSLSDAELLTTYGFVTLEEKEGGGEGEEETGNPNNRVVLLSEALIKASSAVVSGKGGSDEGVLERAAALRKSGALPGAFSITRGESIPNALFGVASLLCLGKVAAAAADDDGKNDDDENEHDERERAAETLWREAQEDLCSVVENLGVEEALEGAPEIAYAASLAIGRAAAAAVEALQAGARAAAEVEAEEEEKAKEKKSEVDVVFARRAALARAVRERELKLLRLLRLAAVQAAGAAMEAVEEEEEEEEGSGEEEEEEKQTVLPSSSSGDKRTSAAAAAAGPESGGNKKKKTRG